MEPLNRNSVMANFRPATLADTEKIVMQSDEAITVSSDSYRHCIQMDLFSHPNNHFVITVGGFPCLYACYCATEYTQTVNGSIQPMLGASKKQIYAALKGLPKCMMIEALSNNRNEFELGFDPKNLTAMKINSHVAKFFAASGWELEEYFSQGLRYTLFTNPRP